MCFWVIAWYINMHIYYVSIKLQIKKYTIRELYRDEVRKKNAIIQNWETGQSTGLHRKIRK